LKFSKKELKMAQHRVYRSIVQAVNTEKLSEPFTVADFEKACPGFGEGTYLAFLYKHQKGNPGGNSELFEMTSKGKFKLIRPIKYGIE